MTIPVIVSTDGMSAEDARVVRAQYGFECARALAEHPAWDWFVAECEARAETLERQLLKVTEYAEQRAEDRARGQAAALRAMPDIVIKKSEKFARLKREAAEAAANREQQEQHDEWSAAADGE